MDLNGRLKIMELEGMYERAKVLELEGMYERAKVLTY